MSCIECNYQFSPVSVKYYCCDRNLPVCILCRRKPCKKCNNIRNTQLSVPTCDKCYHRKKQEQMFCQYNCGKFYCSQCLSLIFRNAYEKISNSSQFIDKDVMVKMYCGDEIPYDELFLYFLNFCVQCGRNYQQVIDYELNNGAKLCSLCAKTYFKIYQNNIFKCLCCQSICRNSSKTMNFQGSILCQDCFKESNIEQSVISSSRLVQNNPPIKYNYVVNQNSLESNNFSKSQINKSKNFQIKEENYIKKQELNVKNEQASSKLNNLFKKESIKQLKQKKIAERLNKMNQNSLDGKTILSKFSSQYQEIEDLSQQNIKLKKHLSNQTVIQNFKIQVKRKDNEEQEICEQCGIVTDVNCFLMSSSKKQISQFSTTESLSSQSKIKQEFKKKLCRCCYVKSVNKSFLGFSNDLQEILQRNKHVSAPKYKPNSLYQSPQKNKQNQNLKQKSSQLTSTENTSNLNNNRYLKLSSNENKEFGKTSMISATSSKNEKQSNFKINKPICNLCKQDCNSYINSLSYGQVCMNCYYKRR